MNHLPESRRRSGGAWGWIVVLVLALGFTVWDAHQRRAGALELSARYGVTVDAPPMDPVSPTGYAEGRRSLLLPGRSLDGYHWIAQTQTMVARGQVRVRQVDYDNAPHGREVHWAQPYRWWLLTLAWIDQRFTGLPFGVALERGALLTGPVLLVLVLGTVAPFLACRFSPIAALFFVLGALGTYPFYLDFAANYPDHHGIANVCALLSILFLIDVDRTGSRKAAILAGVAGGIGMWISASTQAPVLLGIVAGSLLACRITRPAPSVSRWRGRPELFRWWGGTGATVSMLAYLLEYAPHHFGLRLEVNHPLYALGWLAAAELLYRIARPRPPGAGWTGREFATAAGCLAIAILPGAVILAASNETFRVADPFLWRLHANFISEFQSLPRYLTTSGLTWKVVSPVLPLFVTMAALLYAVAGRLPREHRGSLALAGTPAVFALIQAVQQIRWWSLAFATVVPVAAAVFRALEADQPLRRRAKIAWTAGALALVVPGVAVTVQRAAAPSGPQVDDVRALAERDLAHWLRQRVGHGRAIAAAAPSATTGLVFHGGFSGVGSLYWENLDGLRAIAAIYGARTDGEAREFMRQRGITHLVVISWDGLEGAFVRLDRGLPVDAPLPGDAFIVRLLTSALPPPWLRPVLFPLPAHPALEGQQVRVYEVTDEQTPEQSLAAAVAFHLATGRLDVARRLVASFAEQTRGLRASVLRAKLSMHEGDANAFGAAVRDAREQLDQAATLSPAEQVHLIAALLDDNEPALAQQQLRRLLAGSTADTIRTLPTGELAQIVGFAETLHQPWPTAVLRAQALKLLPPALRPPVSH